MLHRHVWKRWVGAAIDNTVSYGSAGSAGSTGSGDGIQNFDLRVTGWIFLSGLPWAGSVQWGGFLFKAFWTCLLFWPDTCLVKLTKSYLQVAKSHVQVAQSDVQVAKSYAQFQSLIVR